MKTLKVVFEDREYTLLSSAKAKYKKNHNLKNLSWREFLKKIVK